MTDNELHSWVDESMHLLDDGSGWYILAAVVCDPVAAAASRDTLRSLLLRRQPRLHWHTEDGLRRTKLAEAVAALDVKAVVVLGSPLVKSKQERARRICMERLFPELVDRGVTRVWFESRTDKLNARDRDQVAAMRGAKWIDGSLRVDVALPLQEPMLWAADIVAGAVGAARVHGVSYLDAMQDRVTHIEVGLR
jgi:hypothetical protein